MAHMTVDEVVSKVEKKFPENLDAQIEYLERLQTRLGRDNPWKGPYKETFQSVCSAYDQRLIEKYRIEEVMKGKKSEHEGFDEYAYSHYKKAGSKADLIRLAPRIAQSHERYADDIVLKNCRNDVRIVRADAETKFYHEWVNGQYVMKPYDKPIDYVGYEIGGDQRDLESKLYHLERAIDCHMVLGNSEHVAELQKVVTELRYPVIYSYEKFYEEVKKRFNGRQVERVKNPCGVY